MSLGGSKVTEIRTLMQNVADMTNVVGAEMQKLASLISLKDSSIIDDSDATTQIAAAKVAMDAAIDTLNGILGVD